MQLFNYQEKSTPGWGYWGDYSEIEVGISSGSIEDATAELSDPLHAHKKGVVYFVVTEGTGQIEVNGRPITISKDQVLQIDPGESYRYLSAQTLPFRWITFCTVKDANDKVTHNE